MGANTHEANPYAQTRVHQPIAHGALNAGGMQGSFDPGRPNGALPAQGGVQPKAAQAPGPFAALSAQWSALPRMKQFLYVLFLFAFPSGAYALLADDPPPVQEKPVANADASAPGTGPSTNPSSIASVPTVPPVVPTPGTAWPANYPCPPDNWPPGMPLPCTPNNAGVSVTVATATPGVPTTPTTATDPVVPRPPGTTKDGVSTTTSGTKSLERRAVDAFAAGDFALATAHYTELAKNHPDNLAYAEAARILGMRANGSTP
jgi:hypothetical protein